MGLKFQILKKLEKSEKGLTVNELSKLLEKENKEVVRMILMRDLVKKGLAIELKEKRNGSKVYKKNTEENNGDNKDSKEYMKKLFDIMLTGMKPKRVLTETEKEDLKEIEGMVK